MKQQVQQPAPVSRTLQGKAKASNQASVSDVLQAYKKDISQRQEIEDDDELLQGKFETTQRDELEDDELLQGKFETAQRDELEDNELLQGKFETTQRDELEDDELLQGKFETTQCAEMEDDELLQGKFETTQRQETPNNTGLPDSLKTGVEQLSGLDMSDVKVHYNSAKPASVQAYAYTQGTDIHVAPGQEKHLGHEAWHVAQQKQGRVQPTTTVGSMPVNDNVGLENEADVMGEKAVQMKPKENNSVGQKKSNGKQVFGFVDNRIENFQQNSRTTKPTVVQCKLIQGIGETVSKETYKEMYVVDGTQPIVQRMKETDKESISENEKYVIEHADNKKLLALAPTLSTKFFKKNGVKTISLPKKEALGVNGLPCSNLISQDVKYDVYEPLVELTKNKGTDSANKDGINVNDCGMYARALLDDKKDFAYNTAITEGLKVVKDTDKWDKSMCDEGDIGGNVGNMYVIYKDNKDLKRADHHAATIIAKDGDDEITSEAHSGKDITKPEFKMYGPKKQSFYSKNKDAYCGGDNNNEAYLAIHEKSQ